MDGCDVRHNMQRNIQQKLGFVDGIDDDVLDELHVAVVARRKVGEHGRDLVRHGLHAVAACTQHLEHVRIALVRHDARAGGELFGQRDESVVLTRILHDVGSETCERGEGLSKRNSCELLGASARHLSKGAGNVHAVEVQRARGKPPVKRKRRAISGSTA